MVDRFHDVDILLMLEKGDHFLRGLFGSAGSE